MKKNIFFIFSWVFIISCSTSLNTKITPPKEQEKVVTENKNKSQCDNNISYDLLKYLDSKKPSLLNQEVDLYFSKTINKKIYYQNEVQAFIDTSYSLKMYMLEYTNDLAKHNGISLIYPAYTVDFKPQIIELNQSNLKNLDSIKTDNYVDYFGELSNILFNTDENDRIGLLPNKLEIHFKNTCQIEDFKKVYGSTIKSYKKINIVGLENLNLESYEITIDTSKVNTDKLFELLKQYNKNYYKDIKEIRFSSVDALKTFYLYMDINLNFTSDVQIAFIFKEYPAKAINQ